MFSALPESQQSFGLSGDAPRPGLRIDLPAGGPAYWEERRLTDAGLVRDTERRRRKIEQEIGRLHFELHAANAEAALDHLVAMKREQYSRTGADDSLGSAFPQALLHQLLTVRQPDCEGMISSLHAGETWVASHFGLRCGATLSYWFPVYNPNLTKFSPGRLLLLEIINAAASSGIQIIDRGEGASKAKRDFATAQQLFFRGRWSRPGARSTLNKIDDSVRWRLMRVAR